MATSQTRLFDRSAKVSTANPVKVETIAGGRLRITLRASDGEMFTRDIRKIHPNEKDGNADGEPAWRRRIRERQELYRKWRELDQSR